MLPPWSLADLLHSDFKQSQYGRIILPFTLLRRLECVLAASKEAVLAEFEKVQKMNLPEEVQEKLLLRATNGLSFFNTSKMDLSKLGETGIKANLDTYLQGFYKDPREIFEHFKFAEFIGQLNDANLLYKIVQKVRTTNLSPKAISKHDMGKVQLINGVNLCGKMRKSLGSKRNVMDDEDIVTITRSFGEFEVIDARELDKPTEQKSNRGRQPANPKTETAKTFSSKIFATHEFGAPCANHSSSVTSASPHCASPPNPSTPSCSAPMPNMASTGVMTKGAKSMAR
ncbi:MAG: type I restriction-modification system subunit M N-terminal domain-containing protein [Candidatus Thiodiazotropha taylori]